MKGLISMTIVLAFVIVSLSFASPTHAGYQVVEVKNGGTLAGKVMWKGPKPTLEQFKVTQDTEICDKDKSGLKTSPRLEIGEGGGVQNAVVYLENIEQGKDFPPQKELLIDQVGCEYEPHILLAPKRSSVTLNSSDEILHNVHMHGAAAYNIPFPEKNTVKRKMRKAGVVDVACDAGHSWMSAFIHVVEHPYYAITDSDGSFKLDDVPPGKYVVKAWHEGWKVIRRTMKEGVIAHYEFSEPVILSKEIEVAEGGSTTVNFELK